MRNTNTSRRDQIELFIAQFCIDHCGNTPSTIEVAKAFGLTQQTVYSHMQRLVLEDRLIQVDSHWILSGATYIPPNELMGLLKQPYNIPHKSCVLRGKYLVEDLQNLYQSQQGRCWWCQKELSGVYEVDHRCPISKGGTNAVENLCLSCSECNRRKGDRLPYEVMGRLI